MSIEEARKVLELEARGIMDLIPRVGPSFTEAVELIYQCTGRVVVSGIGKSGIIGRKIVATLNSTGTPALFLHPVEAMHGDLGMVTSRDILLAISNSGETEELNTMLPSIRQAGARIIAFTGNPNSTLARKGDVVIDVGVEREACPLGLSPTTSTTAALAMGDALSVALITKRNFNEVDFQRFHPGGNLGHRLTSIQVKEVMLVGAEMPAVRVGQKAINAVDKINEKNLGVALVLDDLGELRGIITDGDIRRAVKMCADFRLCSVEDIMTVAPITIHENTLALEALDLMEQKEITCLVTVDKDNRLRGLVHLHDLLGRGKFRFTRDDKTS
jgi:arabinose-5-phosphate isomerase